MTRRSQLKLRVLAGIIAACALALVLVNLLPKEPVYQGKRLSAWLTMLYETKRDPAGNLDQVPPAPDVQRQTTEAIRQIGPAAIPVLMKMLRHKESRVGGPVEDLLRKLRLVRAKPEPSLEPVNRALAGFAVLGPLARPAIPELARMLQKEETCDVAAVALNRISQPESVAPLTQGLTNRSAKVRAAAAAALGVRTVAAPAIPALLNCLKDENPDVRGRAAVSLGAIGEKPEEVVPLLVERLSDPSPACRSAAAQALGMYGAKAAAAIPALEKLKTDPEEQVRTMGAISIRIVQFGIVRAKSE